jgi:hypothetical protein
MNKGVRKEQAVTPLLSESREATVVKKPPPMFLHRMLEKDLIKADNCKDYEYVSSLSLD